MRRPSRISLYAVKLLVLTIFAFTPISHAEADNEQGEGVVGTWSGTLTLNTSPPISFTELGSLNLGGTMAGVNGISHFCQNPLVQNTPLAVDLSGYFGSWAPTGSSDQITLTFKRLLFACSTNTPAIYGPSFPGQNIGLAIIQAVLTLEHSQSGDFLSGPFTFQLTTLPLPLGDGHTVFAGSGTVSLTRVAIEPLMP